MDLRRSALALVLFAAPVSAWAQPFQGPYIGAGAGYDLPLDSSTSHGLKVQPNGGFAGLASIGYGLGNGFRFEIEGDYRHASLHESNAVASVSGDRQTYGVMANALYDLDIGLPWMYPYLGAGAGYAWTEYELNAAPGLSGTENQTHGAFAAQAIAGVSFPIAGVPGLSLTAEYRFFAIPGSQTYTCCVLQANTGLHDIAIGGAKVGHQYDNSFMLGVRYAFGQAPPAAPAVAPAAAPAPAVAPARSYLVFFDWDKATLTDRARQIIHEAADNSTHVQYTRIEVNGYTDTSGTPQYNMGLSIRRANAVKAELIRDGVPAAAIGTQGFGETHLLVPTGPGVREPQNRRVEIIIH